MKKVIITIAIIAGIVTIPVLGMAITPTRDLLLGLTPDEKILALADRIDENRMSTEQTDVKIAELQSTIDNQKAELAEYQKQIEAQNNEIAEAKTTTEETQAKVSNESECRKLYAENSNCGISFFRTKDNFKKYMDRYKENGTYDKWYPEKKSIFDKCQEIIAKCG